LIKLRFERIESNHDVFIDLDMIIVIYVNDLLISESNVALINKMQKKLFYRFKMTDLEIISHYLKMKVDFRSDIDQISLRQSIYIRKILIKFEYMNDKTSSIPMSSDIENILIKSETQTNATTIA
jgi:hypothetical protein